MRKHEQARKYLPDDTKNKLDIRNIFSELFFRRDVDVMSATAQNFPPRQLLACEFLPQAFEAFAFIYLRLVRQSCRRCVTEDFAGRHRKKQIEKRCSGFSLKLISCDGCCGSLSRLAVTLN
jgi:hypothetical protein